MAKIIAVLNTKGGTGKTTLATNLAGSLHKRGYGVLIADSDLQGTARDWSNAKPDDVELPAVVGMDRPKGVSDVVRVGQSYDFVIIDGAAKLEDMAVAALKAADLVLIPVQPSGYDIWAVRDLADLIHARQEITDGKPKAAFVVSRQIQGTNLAQEINEAIEGFGFPVLVSRTTQRVVYTEAGQSGLTVFELEPDGKAAQEIDGITSELLELLTHEQSKTAVA